MLALVETAIPVRHLIEGMADVQVAIGVRRAVVQCEGFLWVTTPLSSLLQCPQQGQLRFIGTAAIHPC